MYLKTGFGRAAAFWLEYRAMPIKRWGLARVINGVISGWLTLNWPQNITFRIENPTFPCRAHTVIKFKAKKMPIQ
ncbi:hypothetical protein B9T34_17600 [Acinetobacter sp. ANC 3813]|nr:hypothetical protein B9T34_17600 [Acinetobacter sp. ANC 3813]